MQYSSSETKVVSTLLDKLGSELVESGLITQSQLNEAQKYIEESGGHLGEALLELGYISMDKLNEFIAEIIRAFVKSFTVS